MNTRLMPRNRISWLLLALLTAAATAHAGDIWLDGGYNAVGQDFTVSLNIRDTPDLYGAGFDVVFNSTTLTASDIGGDPNGRTVVYTQSLGALGQGGAGTNIVGRLEGDSQGRVVIGHSRESVDTGADLSASTRLLQFRLRRLASIDNNSISLDDLYFVDSAGSVIPMNILPTSLSRNLNDIRLLGVPAGAAWNLLDAESNPYSGSGDDTVRDVPTGPVQVTWGDLANYDTPSPNPITYNLTDQSTLTVVAGYIRHTGTAIIEVVPPNAAWTLSDGDGVISQGTGPATVPFVATGNVSVTWQPLPDFDTPAPANTTLARDETQRFVGIYLSSTSTELRQYSSILAYLIGLTSDPTGLDANGDGAVDIADMVDLEPNLPPWPVTSPSPADGAQNVPALPTLDWADAIRGQTYDVFIWPAGEPRPGTPVASGLSSSQYTVATPLAFSAAYNWQVTARNASGPTQGAVWSFTTEPGPPIEVTAPVSGQSTYVGGQTLVEWTADLARTGTAFRIELWHGTFKVGDLADGFTDTGSGSVAVTIPNTAISDGYSIRVVSYYLESIGDPQPSDESPTFKILTGPVVVARPNGGETWTRGASADIQWLSDPAIGGTAVRLELWQGPTFVGELVNVSLSAEGNATETITVPDVTPGDYSIRVVSYYLESIGDPNAVDYSDAPFTIQ